MDLVDLITLTKSAVLNLGYVRRSQGVREIKKKCSKEALLGRIFDLGVCEGHIILIWGTQRGTILIWGYAGTKRLRTPELNDIVTIVCGLHCC